LKANNNHWRWWFYGITKDLSKNDPLLVYRYDSNLPENLFGVTLKYKIDGLIDKLHNILNKLMINRNYLSVKTIETTIETLKTIEDCANYKDKEVGRNSFDEFRKLINKIGKKYNLVENLFEINTRLNDEILCESCKEKKIEKLTDKCGNKEVARVLHECRLNPKHHNNYIRWIPIIHGMVINLVTRNYVINFIFNISNYVITYYVLRFWQNNYHPMYNSD